jgi:TrmH family RNA methyltransferase
MPRTFDVTLTNPRADSVKKVRALFERSARTRYQRFLVEGPQGVREAVRLAGDGVRDVYLTPEAAARYPDIAESARHVHVATPEVLDAMSSDAQGVLAVADIRAVALDAALSHGTARLVAVLSNVRDPGNAGTVIRAADAAGADAVVLAGDSVDPYNAKTVRATAGSLFHIPVISGIGLVDAVSHLRAAGLRILAADGRGDDDLFGYPYLARPTAWVFGNEAWGLRSEDIGLADAVVRVPIIGAAESLNLAAAAAVCLYATARAHHG